MYIYIYILYFKFLISYRLELRGNLILWTIRHISSFRQAAQWLERVHGKHDVVGSNRKTLPQNEYKIYIDKLHCTSIIHYGLGVTLCLTSYRTT